MHNDHQCILVPFSQYVLGYKQFYSLLLHIVNRNESLQMISYNYWEINFLSPGSPESISQIPSGPWIMLLGAFLSLHAKSFRAWVLMGLRSRSRQTSQFVPESATSKKVWNYLVTSFYLSSDLFIHLVHVLYKLQRWTHQWNFKPIL